MDEGVGEAALMVGLRMVSTMRIYDHGRCVRSCSGRSDEGARKRIWSRGLVSWQSGPCRVENGIGDATPVGLMMVSAKRLS